MSELLTLDQTAAMLGKTRETLLRWHKARGFPIHRISRQTAFCDTDEIAAWVRKQSQHDNMTMDDFVRISTGGNVIDFSALVGEVRHAAQKGTSTPPTPRGNSRRPK